MRRCVPPDRPWIESFGIEIGSGAVPQPHDFARPILRSGRPAPPLRSVRFPHRPIVRLNSKACIQVFPGGGQLTPSP